MFPYDSALLAAVQATPRNIADVLAMLASIDEICADGDGLKWFNWLYRQVTEAVAARVTAGEFNDSSWIAALDVQFARFYFAAVASWLSGASTPDCWQALLERRSQSTLARIQFAMAGINAHINHDLAEAIVTTCEEREGAPQRGAAEYSDYTALNTTLDSLIESARQALHVRLLGDALPPVSGLEDALAAWSVAAAREAAWNNAELLWHLRDAPPLAGSFMETLDGFTALAGKALLVPVP